MTETEFAIVRAFTAAAYKDDPELQAAILEELLNGYNNSTAYDSNGNGGFFASEETLKLYYSSGTCVNSTMLFFQGA